MNFINLNSLQIEQKENYTTKEIVVDNAAQLLDLTVQELSDWCNLLFLPMEDSDEPIVLCVQLNNFEEDFFEYFVNIVIDNIIRNNTKEKNREREYRLGLPKDLKEVYCNQLPLQIAINKECHYNVFNILIIDKGNDLRYECV